MYCPSTEISSAYVPSGCGSKIVLRGIPDLASHTTSMESGPLIKIGNLCFFFVELQKKIYCYLIQKIILSDLRDILTDCGIILYS